MTLHGSNRHMGSIQGTRIYSPQPEVSGWAISPPRRRQGSLLGSWVICNLVVVGYRGYW